jgi:SRSO17 transposase
MKSIGWRRALFCAAGTSRQALDESEVCADQVNPLQDYCTNLMMTCKRKSVEAMTAVQVPAPAATRHQSLLHSVGQPGR